MKKTYLSVTITAATLFVTNFSFNQDLINRAEAQNSWTGIISTIISSFSSIGSSSGGDTELLKASIRNGKRDCGEKIDYCYRYEQIVQPDGTIKETPVYVGKFVKKCGKLVEGCTAIYDFTENIINTKGDAYAYVRCEGFSLSVCKARDLTCEEQGHSCN